MPDSPPSQQNTTKLFDELYDELKSIARIHMGKQHGQQTLQPTALINEAFIRLQRRQKKSEWVSQNHFLRTAAKVMQQVLIDHARTKTRQKRGGKQAPVELTGIETAEITINDDLLAVHEALLKLEKESPEKAELVTLRFFAGLTIDEAADTLSISRTTAKQWWQFCRAWLHHELSQP